MNTVEQLITDNWTSDFREGYLLNHQVHNSMQENTAGGLR